MPLERRHDPDRKRNRREGDDAEDAHHQEARRKLEPDRIGETCHEM
jgi:hypothetical protein